MVLWCKQCGAYLGLIEPVTDWTVNRNALCLRCAKKNRDLGPEVIGAIIKNEHFTSQNGDDVLPQD